MFQDEHEWGIETQACNSEVPEPVAMYCIALGSRFAVKCGIGSTISRYSVAIDLTGQTCVSKLLSVYSRIQDDLTDLIHRFVNFLSVENIN
jgi:hypothetical protein